MNEIKDIDKIVIMYDYDSGFSDINHWYDGFHRININVMVVREFDLMYLETLNYRDLTRL